MRDYFIACISATDQWSVNSSEIDQSVTLFLGWRKLCLPQKSPQSVFSRLVPIRCCIITSWFAIVLSEIRTGQILREKLDCKQSIATCISGCALFFSHYFLLMCLHFLYQEHNKDCCLFVCLYYHRHSTVRLMILWKELCTPLHLNVEPAWNGMYTAKDDDTDHSKRPFYSYGWNWGWGWPCFDTNLLALLCKSSYSYAKHTVAFFKDNFHNKAKEVCIKTRSLSASQSFEG